MVTNTETFATLGTFFFFGLFEKKIYTQNNYHITARRYLKQSHSNVYV